MGQFDSPSEAALERLRSERLLASSVAAPVAAITGIGTKILDLCGLPGVANLHDVIASLTGLAVRKDEQNLFYFGEALVNDISRLYRLSDAQRETTTHLLSSPEFETAVQNATLYIVRTNVRSRLKRLANVITNGVRFADLEPGTLDDMMRLAVTVTEADISLLGDVYEMQKDMLTPENMSKQPGERINALMRAWQMWWNTNAKNYTGMKGLEFKNSCARLLAAGLVGPVQRSYAGSPNANDMELLIDGLRFYEHLQELA